jgi:hypothetical protein
MDVSQLLRLKGTLEAVATRDVRADKGQAESYVRIRAEVARAVEPSLTEELERLFPAELSTAGQPWGVQAQEAMTLMGALSGWLGGIIDGAVLDQRIRAEAEERAKRTGFA